MFKNIFVRLCNKKGIAPTAVCTDIGLSKSAYSLWTDDTVPRKSTLLKIADYFGVSVDYLLGKETTPVTDPAHVVGHQERNEVTSKRVIRMPIYENFDRQLLIDTSHVPDNPSIAKTPTPYFSSNSIASPIPYGLIIDEQEYEEYRANPGEEHMYTAIRLHDDSMAPRMMPGDVVIVKLQKTLNDGDIAVLCPEDVAICRKIKKTPEGILLLATNQIFEPIFCSNAQLSSGDVRIIGIVAELRAKFTSL